MLCFPFLFQNLIQDNMEIDELIYTELFHYHKYLSSFHMNIKVNYCYFFILKFFYQISSSYSHVVVNTKTHCFSAWCPGGLTAQSIFIFFQHHYGCYNWTNCINCCILTLVKQLYRYLKNPNLLLEKNC